MVGASNRWFAVFFVAVNRQRVSFPVSSLFVVDAQAAHYRM